LGPTSNAFEIVTPSAQHHLLAPLSKNVAEVARHPAMTAQQPTIIGFILSNGGTSRNDRYKCHMLDCARTTTFKRLADLKRHHASVHNAQGVRLFCPVDGCERSMKIGGRGFPRKDKMVDHLERAHADKVSCGSE
jgi:hypothetical protein